MKECTRCGNLIFREHHCQTYEVVHIDDWDQSEQTTEINAISEENAAREYARRWNEETGDYPMMGEGDREIKLRIGDMTFIVEAVEVINYAVTETTGILD